MIILILFINISFDNVLLLLKILFFYGFVTFLLCFWKGSYHNVIIRFLL